MGISQTDHVGFLRPKEDGMPANIFVLGMEESNKGETYSARYFETIRDAEDYRFRPLLNASQIYGAPHYPVAELLDEAEAQLRAHDGSVDALLTIRDFPSSTMAPLLRSRFGLPGPTLESVLRCEHKYWSRVEQRAAIPEHVPEFVLVDPFGLEAGNSIGLDFPFWLKPVKSYASVLGFLIEDESDLRRALKKIRSGIERFAEPFNYVMAHADVPDDIASADGFHCVAERIISSELQCTLEGYVYDREPIIYGVVDSVRAEGGSSFARYQYPSRLTRNVQDRMASAAQQVMRRVGYDNGAFNIEFFYDEDADQVWILEINARISGAHSPIFEMVEGTPHNEVAVHLSLGQRPDYPRGEGEFGVAAKFMMRRFEDATVTSVPDEAELERAREEFPELHFELRVEEGTVLAELPEQDSYSYEYAVAYLGATDEDELEAKYDRLQAMLTFEFEPVD